MNSTEMFWSRVWREKCEKYPHIYGPAGTIKECPPEFRPSRTKAQAEANKNDRDCANIMAY